MSPDHVCHLREYLDDVSRHVYEINETQVERIVSLLVETVTENRLILAAGNGGSFLTAAHLAVDLEKCISVAVPDRVRGPGVVPRVHVLGLNGGTLMAWSNDEVWALALARQVEVWGSPGDVLICLSASGASQNLLQAARLARQRGMTVAALVGKKESPLEAMAHVALVVGTDDVQVAEDVHSCVCHCLFREVRRRIVERTGG